MRKRGCIVISDILHDCVCLLKTISFVKILRIVSFYTLKISQKIYSKESSFFKQNTFLRQFNYQRSLLVICLMHLQSLTAEIEQIQISWNAFKCQFNCIEQINQHFSSIKGVRDLKINGQSGIGDMKWTSTNRLSYEPFRYAAAAVGINIISMRVRVKGTITHDSENIYIVSDVDGTRLNLIGPLYIESGRYIPKYNRITHPLSNEAREQLLIIEKQGKSIVISGPLFLPSHYPLTLVTEEIKMN